MESNLATASQSCPSQLEEIVEGNEAVAAQLSKTRASEAGGTAAPKRSREGEDSESGTKRTKGDE